MNWQEVKERLRQQDELIDGLRAAVQRSRGTTANLERRIEQLEKAQRPIPVPLREVRDGRF